MADTEGLAPVLVTPPATPPITVEEVKALIRVDFEDHDTLLAMLIESATGDLEAGNGARRAIISQTWRESFDAWPTAACGIELRVAPVTSITSVKYRDSSNVEQTVSASNYELVQTDNGKTYVRFVGDFDGSELYENRQDRVQVTYVAGAATAPADLKIALAWMVWILLEGPNDDLQKAIDRKIAKYWRPVI